MIYQNKDYNFDKLFVGPTKRFAKKQDKTQIELMYSLTSFYPKMYDDHKDLLVRAYILKNNLSDKDLKCQNSKCSNFVKFNSPSKGFVKYCCPKCANTDSVQIESRKQTNLKKFGHECNFSSDVSKTKKIETNLKKYGHSNVLCSDHGKYLRKQSMSEQYGTNKTYTNKHILNFDNWNNKQYIIDNFISDDGYLESSKFLKYFECLSPAMFIKLKELNIEYKKRTKTRHEYDIIDFINNDTIIHSDRSLICKELDILIPDVLAIEFNGLMYHSHGISNGPKFNNPVENRNRHMIKTELCEKQNIQLLQIFENEWINEKQNKIWKSIINSKLNKNTKVFARKCYIKEVDYKTTANFLEDNHIQGACVSSINYGLYYNNELMSIMTFGKSRFSKEYEWELIRFCNKININVVGGASKLLKHFEKNNNPLSIVSYANRRWSNGKLYKTLNFEHTHNSPPNYFYFKQNEIQITNLKKDSSILESRNKYQKHKLKTILKNYDETLSETSNMFNNNYRKIFDCGNMIFIKKYEGYKNV